MTGKELEQIYNEAYKAVYWTAMAFMKNEADAEDIVQDTFVALIESYDSIKDKSKVTAWLKKTAANKCLNRIKLSRTDNMDDEFFEGVEAVPEDFLPDSIVESEDARKIVMNIINNSLSDDIRRTLILFYFDEMSIKEIAVLLGVPEGTVSRRLNFARNKIKKEVEKYEKDNDTKLYGMAIPFLTKLFMKEAEQVVFKPMPAKLISLSASSQASKAGAATKIAASAAKKGTGIMKTKILIGGLAGVVAVGATIGIIVAVLNNNPEKVEPVETTAESNGPANTLSDVGFATTGESEETEETESTMELTEDSIVIHMDGMTADEIVENVWKTANVKNGMTKEDYEALFYIPDDKTLAGKPYATTDTWYWQFYGLSSDVRISMMNVVVPLNDDGKIDFDIYVGKGAGVAPCINFDDPDFGAEVFEKCIEKYESLGFEIVHDDSLGTTRVVELSNGSETYRISYDQSNIALNIPIYAN
jgi:RNA polymerase sigma factor (sigma-70 family)